MPSVPATVFASLLSEQAFTFSPVGLKSIHRRLFEGELPSAGEFREGDHTRPEWVLGGETVVYASAPELQATLEYEFAKERQVDFNALSLHGVMEHLAAFVATIWQIHPFACGNAHVVAVFAARYLRYLGFEVDGRVVVEHFSYFRNALVRACFRNFRLRVMPDMRPLVKFLGNVALGEKHLLDSQELCVNPGQGAPRGAPHPAPLPAPAATSLSADTLHLRQKRLLRTLGAQTLSVPEMLKALRLSSRQSFVRVWLAPAMELGLVKALHPESPRHPQQQYLLTRTGQRLLKQLIRK